MKNRRKRQRIRQRGVPVPVKALIPNLVTSIAACAGITSIVLSAEGSFVKALFALLVACICDGMDGRVARMLNASSKLGAELDSLADFVNFGVAPALFMFFWLTGGPEHAGVAPGTVKIILGCALFYALCDCFRLARFNTMLEQPSLPYWKHFFTGVPAPGGCWMVLTPAILAVALDAKGKLPGVQAVLQHPLLGGFMLLFIGSLMASRLPTVSLKALHFTSRRQMRLFMAFALLLIALLVSNLWLTLGIAGLLYILTIPVTCRIFLGKKRKYLARLQSGA